MSKDYGYFGKGTTAYVHYMQTYDRIHGSSIQAHGKAVNHATPQRDRYKCDDEYSSKRLTNAGFLFLMLIAVAGICWKYNDYGLLMLVPLIVYGIINRRINKSYEAECEREREEKQLAKARDKSNASEDSYNISLDK